MHAIATLLPLVLDRVSYAINGVPLVRAFSDETRLDGLELMLKGGQMGPPDLFVTLRSGT